MQVVGIERGTAITVLATDARGASARRRDVEHRNVVKMTNAWRIAKSTARGGRLEEGSTWYSFLIVRSRFLRRTKIKTR